MRQLYLALSFLLLTLSCVGFATMSGKATPCNQGSVAELYDLSKEPVADSHGLRTELAVGPYGLSAGPVFDPFG